MSLPRAFQWLGVAAVVLVLVGLNFDFESEAGKTVNAPVEDSLSQSLLGYWKMDEGTGTSTTADSSGNSNNLTMTNADAEDWQAGQIGDYGLDFNGTDEWLTVADPSSGVLDIVEGADFSIVGWFNRDTEDTIDTLVAKRNSDGASDAGYLVWIGTNDLLYFEVSDGTDQYSRASTSTYATTGWHQFAAVWDDGSGMNLFIDGVNEGSDTGTLGNIGSLANTVAFRIGAESSTGTENPFDGKIDDVKLYSHALSASEVSRLYQTTVPASPVDTGLVGHWTFDGNDVNWGDSTSEIKDVSGKGNHGDATGTTPVRGKLGQGLSFNGTSDYVNVGDLNNATDGVSYLTVSAWVKQSAHVASYKSPLGKYNGLNEHWNIMTDEYGGTGGYYDVRVRIDYNNYGQTIGTKIHKINEWEHWVMVFDGTQTGNENRLKFYFNGSQQELYLVGTIPSVTNSSNDSVVIGDRGSDAPQYSWNGSIDDVRIYNRAFSASEVLQLYNLGK